MKTTILLFAWCIGISFDLLATRWYISVTGAGAHTGTSWANACNATQLQLLINSGDLGDSVWVAAGVYKPTLSLNLNLSFTLRSDLKMFGGFPQPTLNLSNPTWANRNPKVYATVFSGDLENNDHNLDGNFRNQTTDSIVGDNSFHLFTGNIVNANCVIDGCIIVGAYGATYGGGFYNYYYSSPTIRNCYIVGNEAQYGGGAYNYDHSSPNFVNCVFRGNRAGSGAALYNHYTANPVLSATQILGNVATLQGGGAYNNYAYPVFNNCVFAENEAIQGGAIYNHYSAIILTSSVVYNNMAQVGGGVFNNASSMTFNSVTLSKNMAVISGGAIKNNGVSNPKIRNSIVWDNIAPACKNIDNGSNNPLIYNSILEAPYTGMCINCQGINGNVNPQFTQANDANGNDNQWFTNDDGLRLKPCSQGINTGASQYLPVNIVIDIRGKNRIRHQVLDLGAYENGNFEGEGYLTTLNDANTQLSACEECTDANGWTHYYDTIGKKMVLSLFKNGYNIGHIGDGIFNVKSYTSPNYGANAGTLIHAPYAQNLDWYVMNRWWNVSPNPQLPVGSTGVKVRTYFTNQDTTDINGSLSGNNININQLRFYKINGASASLDPDGDGYSNDAHAGVEAAATYCADGYWEYVYSSYSSTNTWCKGNFNGVKYAEYEVARFSGGGGGGAPNGGGAFPITLLSFDGNTTEKGNAFHWTTLQEISGGHFVIERSHNGRDFGEIGDISAIGNSLDRYSYQFLDEKPFWGKNYYRLRLTDFEGYTEYSNMVELDFGEFSFTAYPNPAKNKVYIEGNFPERCELKVFDMRGTEIRSTALNAQVTTEINVEDLAPDLYYFQLRDKEGAVLTVKRVVVEN